MKLYGYWRSSASYRVRIALAMKGIEYEYVSVNLIANGGENKSPEYTAVNPLAQVPTLEFQLDGHTRKLTQSLAIIEMLEELHPAPSVFAKGTWGRARTRQLAEVINSGIQPLQNTETQRYVREDLGGDAKQWTLHWISRGLNALEVMAKESAKDFLVGDDFTLADICLVPQMYAARRFGLDPSTLPTLSAIEARCLELHFVRDAHPDRQPDAVRPTAS